MNRSQQIIDLFNNTVKGSFENLSMSAQVSLVHRILRNTLNNIKYWDQRAYEAKDGSESKTYAERMSMAYSSALPGLYQFLQRASHYSEGVSSVVEFDTSGHDDYGDPTGDSAWEKVVLNGNPHGWAKRMLVEQGLWDDNLDFSKEHPLQLPNMSDATDRIAGQMVARMILVYGSGELYAPRNTDARDMEIMALSSKALAIAKLKPENRLRAAYQLALKHRPFGVTDAELMTAFDEMVQLDEDDAVHAEIKTSKRQARHATNQIIKSAAMGKLIEDTTTRLKAAGLSDEVIGAVVAKMMA